MGHFRPPDRRDQIAEAAGGCREQRAAHRAQPYPTRQFLEELITFYQGHKAAVGGKSCSTPLPATVTLISDRALLWRVLGNMLKNALEASQPGETVTLGCRSGSGQVELWVHNPGEIPEEVRLQIFQRSFSTKGAGRGLGTYSIKLLGERYLRGKVSFITSAATAPPSDPPAR